MSDEITLNMNKMLVIVGKQASGKSRLAADIFSKRSLLKVFELQPTRLTGDLIHAVKDGYDAFIIDEGYPNPDLLHGIISALKCRGPYSKPLFFICCCLPEQLPPCAADSDYVKIHYMDGDSHV